MSLKVGRRLVDWEPTVSCLAVGARQEGPPVPNGANFRPPDLPGHRRRKKSAASSSCNFLQPRFTLSRGSEGPQNLALRGNDSTTCISKSLLRTEGVATHKLELVGDSLRKRSGTSPINPGPDVRGEGIGGQERGGDRRGGKGRGGAGKFSKKKASRSRV